MICVNISYRLFLERYAVLLHLTFLSILLHTYRNGSLSQNEDFFCYLHFKTILVYVAHFQYTVCLFTIYIPFQGLTRYSLQLSGLHIKVNKEQFFDVISYFGHIEFMSINLDAFVTVDTLLSKWKI